MMERMCSVLFVEAAGRLSGRAHHAAEDGAGAGSRTVALVGAGVKNFLQEVQILSFHVFCESVRVQ